MNASHKEKYKVSSESEAKPPPRNGTVNRGRDGNFAERIGREMKSAADLLARLSQNSGGAAGAVAASARAALSSPAVRDADGRWDLDALVSNIAARAARFIGSDTIDPNADFFDLGGTSVNAVELVTTLSRELGVELSLDDLFSDARPQRLAEFWLKKVGAAVPATFSAAVSAAALAPIAVKPVAPQPLDALSSPYAEEDRRAIEADLELANALPWVGPTSHEPPRRILLTGATGFLGSQMLFDLLRRSDAHVVCLVRARDDAAARQRLIAELEQRDLPWSSELERRVSVIAGDIQEPQLGWDDARWQQQAQEIDSVVHVAAAVDFLRGYNSLRKANVLGALTMALFAGAGRVKPLHHISTISVFDEVGIRSMGEDDPPAHIDRLFAGYEKSKWAAEAVLRRARERGLIVSFYRPGGIGGHTVTGVYNPLDLSSGFVAAWQAMRALPEFRYMHVAPVDWVSRIAAEAVLDPTSWGLNYNLTGSPLDLRTVSRNMALGGMNMRVVSFEEWRRLFREWMVRDPMPELEFLGRVLESPTALKLLEATFSAPRAGTDRTDAFVRRRKLPRPPAFNANAMIAMTERLARDGRLRMLGRNDPPYLAFDETMRGALQLLDGSVAAPCNSRLKLSVASFYQMLNGRRIDIHGELHCALLHAEPLVVESGDCWVRPGDGVPRQHGSGHPLLRYSLVLRAADGQKWWFEGIKTARPARDLWSQGRTLAVEVGKEGEPASLRGELIVPPETYIPDQVDGIAINPNVPRQEQALGKLIWMIWFGAQFGLGFTEPMLRSLASMVDAARGFAQEGSQP